MSAAPGNWAQRRYLSPDTQIKECECLVWANRIHHPAKSKHPGANGDDADNVRIGGTRKRTEGSQDAGILDRGFDPYVSLTQAKRLSCAYSPRSVRDCPDYRIQTPVTRCRPPPRSSLLNMRTMFRSLLP